jgi:hypothetical protein
MARRRIEGTQKEHVKALLLAGHRLNHLTLINDCDVKGGWRLGAVIHDLANDPVDPLPIQRAYEGNRRMATYWLTLNKHGQAQLGLPL